MQPDPSLAGATSPVPQVARIPREQLPLSRPYLAPRTGVERRLVEIWQDALQVAPVGVDDDYYELGGNSLRGLEIFLQIEQEYGERLPLSILVEQPTVRSLAEALGRSGAPDRRCLVPLQATGSRPPLFCVHDISGNVVVLRQLAQQLGPDQPFYGLQYPGQTVRPLARHSVEELARRYVDEVCRAQPCGAVRLAGYSLGGIIAFQMAHELRARGREVALLASLDGGGPGFPPGGLDKYVGHALEFLYRNPRTWPSYLRTRLDYRLARQGRPVMFHDDGADLDRTAVQELATDILPQVKAAYHAAVYPGRMHLFRCAEDTVLWRRMPELGWRDLVAGGIEIHDIPATHQYLMVAPAVGVLARELAACLAACPPS